MALNTGHCDFTGQVSTGQFYAPQSAALTLFSSEYPFNVRESQHVVVKHGELLVFDAYQMPDGKKIFLNRLLVGSRGVRDMSGSIMFRKRMDYLGAGQWEITKEQNMLFLTIPGTYMFELEDDSMIDQVYVEFRTFLVKDPLPKEMWGGLL